MNTKHNTLFPKVADILPRRRALAALAATMFALPAVPALAATINVTTTDEFSTSQCTLKDAVRSANSNSAVGGCVSGAPGKDVINLPGKSVFSHTTPFGVGASPSLLVITSEIEINANIGTVIGVAANAPQPMRVMTVTETGKLSLRDVTLTGGRSDQGGGLLVYKGSADLAGVRMQGNTVSGNGGGMAVIEGKVRAYTRAFFYGNSAKSGGGIFNSGGEVEIDNSIITNNTASVSGGGVATGGGSKTSRTTLSSVNLRINKTGGSGGAVAVGYLAEMTINKVDLVGNTAGDKGGAIFNASGGKVLVMNSTLTGNSAPITGGIHLEKAFANLRFVTLFGNVAKTTGGGAITLVGGAPTAANLVGTLVTGNASPQNKEVIVNGVLTAKNYNLFGADGDARTAGFTVGGTDVVPASGVLPPDILNPDVKNIGYTSAHVLVAGSPAVDAAGDCDVYAGYNFYGVVLPNRDQAVYNRPVDGDLNGSARCDIGAMELKQFTLSVKRVGAGTGTVSSQQQGIQCGSDCTENVFEQTKVTLTATPASGSIFTGWSGSCTGTGTCVVDMWAHREVTATFDVATTTDPCANAVPTNTCTVNGVANKQCLGTSGNDTITGSSGNDVIVGGAGNDILKGGSGADLICGGSGDDQLGGDWGDDTLHGGIGNDKLNGWMGNDKLYGNDGNDTLGGDDGNDQLTGGAGTDTANGGEGTDTCSSENKSSCEQ